MSETTEQKNVEILRGVYAQWSRPGEDGGAEWMELLADDVRWRSLSDGAVGMEFSRPHDSRAEVERYFEELAQDWEMVRYTTDEFIAQGDRVVMIGSCCWKSRRNGNVVETPKADVIRMKDGKIVEFFEFFDTAKAYAATR